MSRKTAVRSVTFTLAAGLMVLPGVATATPTPGATATATSDATTSADALGTALAQSGLPTAAQQQIRETAAQIPDRWSVGQGAAERFALPDSEWRKIAADVIDPGSYECDTTELRTWLSAQVADPEVAYGLDILAQFGADQLPTYDALLLGSESRDNSFGVDGDHTSSMNREMTSLERFWDIPTDIQLIPMHGDMLSDRDRVVRGYEVVYGMPTAIAELYADIVEVVIDNVAGLRGGDHPALTFNAFAFDPQGDPVLTEMGVTKRIVIGDGILEGTDGIGLDDKAAPLGILAHEYGHQVQYAKGLFESPLTGPEATRRTELMADAFGTYQTVHARGTALNSARTLDVMQSFYSVGDCSFSSDGHHGTPNQRLRASQWAVDLVKSQSNEGHKLGSLEMSELFDAHLPTLVAPDA